MSKYKLSVFKISRLNLSSSGKNSLEYLASLILPFTNEGIPQIVAILLDTLPLGEITNVEVATSKKCPYLFSNPKTAWYFLSASTLRI